MAGRCGPLPTGHSRARALFSLTAMWVSWGAVPDGKAGPGPGTEWARLRVQCGDTRRPYSPSPSGWFPNSAQQEMPRNGTGVLASAAGLSKHRPRSPSWQQWRIVAAMAGLPSGGPAWTNRGRRPLLAQVCRGFSGTWRPGRSCLCGQSRKWGVLTPWGWVLSLPPCREGPGPQTPPPAAPSPPPGAQTRPTPQGLHPLLLAQGSRRPHPLG